MKKSFYIESNYIYRNGKIQYVPVSQNAKWLYDLLAKHSLECICMKQWSDKRWEIRLRGKKKYVRQFVFEFTVEASKEYSIRETIS